MTDHEKELEELKQELDRSHLLRETLIRIINHDLRGPISNLKSIMGLIQDGDMDFDTAKAFLGELSKGVDHSIQMLVELTDWGAASSFYREKKIEDHNIKSVFAATLEEFSEQIANKSIQVNVEIDDSISVHTDEKSLRVIFRNLLSNGLKFTEKGGVVRVSGESRDGHLVMLFTDSGIGIPDEMKADIFAMKRDTRRAGTENEKSAGTGLFIAKDLIDAKQGSITISDNPSGGTVVKVQLPLTQ